MADASTPHPGSGNEPSPEDAHSDPSINLGAIPPVPPSPGEGSHADQTVIDPSGSHPGLPRRYPQIPGFSITGVIGSGGMGTVYLAKQDHPRRTVAVKVMNADVVNQSTLRRFEFEMQVLARLSHTNIGQLYEAGTWNDGVSDIPYFAMEYISPVRTIREYVDQKQDDLNRCVELIIQACDAVGHAHSKGVIHRDLKPGNILVNAEGQVKVIDFGVARTTDPNLSTMSTRVDALVGTLQYMSPEQCSADVLDLTASADVYALGVTAYELLTSQLPYDVTDKGIATAIQVITEARPESIGLLDRRLRGDLEVIVNKALEKDPADRYRNASEFSDDLRRYLSNDQIMASPPTLVTTIRRVVRRNRGAVAAVSTIMILLSIAAVSGVLALVNSNRALEAENEAYAQQAEKQAMVSELIAYFMKDTYNMFAGLSANPELREQFVSNYMTYIDRLREEDASDPALMAVVAEGLRQAGNNAWSKTAGSRGDLPRAVGLLQESASMLDDLLKQSPGDMGLILASIDTRTNLFEAAMEQDDRDAARRELDAMEQLVGRLPTTLQDEDMWAKVWLVRRHKHLFSPPTGDPMHDPNTVSMLELIDWGLNTLQTDSGQTSNRVLRNATLTWNSVGYSYREIDMLPEASAYYTRALEARKRMLTGDEGVSRSDQNFIRRDINNSRRYVADVAAAMGQYGEAVALLNEVVRSARELVQESPEDNRARGDLALALVGQGVHALAAGDSDAAVTALEDAKRTYGRWASMRNQAVTDYPRSTRELIRTEITLAKAWRLLGDEQKAAEAIQEANRLADLGAERWPTNPELQQQVSLARAMLDAQDETGR